jgi:hypothetical protein
MGKADGVCRFSKTHSETDVRSSVAANATRKVPICRFRMAILQMQKYRKCSIWPGTAAIVEQQTDIKSRHV